MCYVQALAGYPAIDWTRMVYDGSRALGFRGENPTTSRNTRCAAFWLFGAVTTAGSSSQLPGLFFCLQGHLLRETPCTDFIRPCSWGLRRFWPCSCVQRAMSAEQDPRRGRAGLVHGIEQGPGGGGRRGRSFLSYFLVCLPVSCRFALVHLLSPITMSHFH